MRYAFLTESVVGNRMDISKTWRITMIYFHNDYSEGCHEKVLQRLIDTNLEQTTGYGCDEYCALP